MQREATEKHCCIGTARGVVARLLDERQGRGKLVASLDELTAAASLGELATRRQLERLTERVVLLPGRPTVYLTVPNEDRARGAPPVAAWLHDFLRLREPFYYVGLLSAAALHGSAPQAALVTQVLVPSIRRPMVVGRTRIEFITKRGLDTTPLTAVEGLAGPLNVSSPEATVFDLIAFNHRIGGIARALEVIVGLKPQLSVTGLGHAIAAGVPTTVLQRAGYLFETSGWPAFAATVERALPARFPKTPLQTRGSRPNGTPDARWAVIDNVHWTREPHE